MDWDTISTLAESRLWGRLDCREPGKCWNWTGGKSVGGTRPIELRFNSIRKYAYAWAWMIYNRRKIPDGLIMLHSCDNGLCCNPEHLRPGTHAENTADMSDRGRSMKGIPNKRKLTKEQKTEIIRRYNAGGISMRALAKEYNVTYETVWGHIKRARTTPQSETVSVGTG